MLHRLGDLAQILERGRVDLIERDEDTRLVRTQRVGQSFHLRAQGRFHREALDPLAGHAAPEPGSGGVRPRDVALHRTRVMIAQQAREHGLGELVSHPWPSGLGDHQPAAPGCGILDRVEHDRLARAARAGEEHGAARSTRTIVEGVGEGGDLLVSPDQHRWRHTERGGERVLCHADHLHV